MLIAQQLDQNAIEFQEYVKGLQKSPKYVVEQRYYNSGKVEAIFREYNPKTDHNLKIGKAIMLGRYDLYYDVFDTYEEAQKFCQECLEA